MMMSKRFWFCFQEQKRSFSHAPLALLQYLHASPLLIQPHLRPSQYTLPTHMKTHRKAINADKMTQIEMQPRNNNNKLLVGDFSLLFSFFNPRCILSSAHFDSSTFSRHFRFSEESHESIDITLLPSSGQR